MVKLGDMGLKELIFYIFGFLSLYIQVFFFVTFFESKKKLEKKVKNIVSLPYYPKVTIIIPCYNEQDTIRDTVQSVLNLNYPKNKLDIILVNDGSTDNTLAKLKEFEGLKNVRVFDKENGGKHTAINLGIEKAQGDFIAGLDSDSFVDEMALKNIIDRFIKNKDAMAMTPSMLVHKPESKGWLAKAQNAEYDMGIFHKKILCSINAIHVTPGPFSVFRKEVFDKIGNFKKAHNTEDQEIALRMQENGMKIMHCENAIVYTKTPTGIKSLYKQRKRWIYGFLKNASDYKHMLFDKKYGEVGFFTIPSGLMSVLSVLFLWSIFLYSAYNLLQKNFSKISVVGVDPKVVLPTFDWFFVNTNPIAFLMVFIYVSIFISLIIGRKISNRKASLKFSDLYLFIMYSFIAPLWILKSIYNFFINKESSWVSERK
ncbi:glycosyltransferase family 2 protein [Candidatus Nomurabacteria bacterium]|nr:glycosyltransferase family 2 protein [Candidatus Nomurabacteria bacterium]